MNTTITYPAGTATDGSRLQVGCASAIAENQTSDYHHSGPSGPIDPPPRNEHHHGRGDDHKPSRLELLARKALIVADILLAVALVVLLVDRHRQRR